MLASTFVVFIHALLMDCETSPVSSG